jgi:hypothetical protein
MKFLSRAALLLVFSGLCGAVIVAWQPEPRPAAEKTAPRNSPLSVGDQIGQAIIKRSAPFDIQEARLNEHLRKVLAPHAGGHGARLPVMPGVPSVSLLESLARVRLCWTLGGRHELTCTVSLTIERQGDRFVVTVLDGQYGRLPVPRGLLQPVRPALEELAQALQPEIEALFQMNDITLAEGRLRLDPRFPDPVAP